MERCGQAILPDRHDAYFVCAVCREDSKRLQGILRYITDDSLILLMQDKTSLTGARRPLIQSSLAFFTLGLGK